MEQSTALNGGDILFQFITFTLILAIPIIIIIMKRTTNKKKRQVDDITIRLTRLENKVDELVTTIKDEKK